jgi:SAM-dependent methyltransferase
MSERAVELLALTPGEKLHLLDVGCGTGLSGELLTELGHTWTGVDVSPSMLDVAQKEGCEGDLIVNDIGEGLPFRAGTFDGAISISTVQWLCNIKKSFSFFFFFFLFLVRHCFSKSSQSSISHQTVFRVVVCLFAERDARCHSVVSREQTPARHDHEFGTQICEMFLFFILLRF